MVGDPLYAGRHGRQTGPSGALPEDVKKTLSDGKGQALHAYILGFNHPVTGERLQFESNKLNYINYLCDIFRSV